MSVRRTWDRELYAAKARVKAETKAQQESEELLAEDLMNIKKRKLDALSTEDLREEFRTADAEAAGPLNSQRSYLKARTTNIADELEKKAGTTQVVTAQAMEMGVGGGFWCEVCSCLLKDSSAYLNHINGKKHQRALGFSMRVESVGVESVKDRLSALKSRLAKTASRDTKGAQGGKNNQSKSSQEEVLEAADALEEHDSKLAAAEARGQELKRARKEAKAAAKQKAKAEAVSANEEEAQKEDSSSAADADMLAMMGFSGFGGRKS